MYRSIWYDDGLTAILIHSFDIYYFSPYDIGTTCYPIEEATKIGQNFRLSMTYR